MEEVWQMLVRKNLPVCLLKAIAHLWDGLIAGLHEIVANA